MADTRYLLGYDVGSSSIKATLLEAESGAVVASATSPRTELPITAAKPGWAEQDPAEWWRHVVLATREMRQKTVMDDGEVAAIGISYQMHGLVMVDKNRALLRPSIIWCDSRGVEIGQKALRKIGEAKCYSHTLNSPGNFTASKLAWVKENEPEVYRRAYKVMLPGDYVAMRLTGEIRTTSSGLSEMILWDYKKAGLADIVTRHFGFSPDLLPDTAPTFSVQGGLTAEAASELGLSKGVPVAYRAGDQPNNAFSLKILQPGEAAATAGTSGVVYGVTSDQLYDSKSRVNTFVHVNHTEGAPRYGVLLCVNGTGILYSWIRRNLMGSDSRVSYEDLNRITERAPAGSDGLLIMPFGNGAERTLEDRNIGSAMLGLDFNRHRIEHVLRAAQEGIIFALSHGLRIMKGMGLKLETVRAGYANMFLSPLFAKIFSAVTGARVELFRTDGSQGAARGAGVGIGLYPTPASAYAGLSAVHTVDPSAELGSVYADAYGRWEEALRKITG